MKKGELSGGCGWIVLVGTMVLLAIVISLI